MRIYILIIILINTAFAKDLEKMFFSVYFNNMKAGNASLVLSEDAKGENYILNFELI